MARMNSPATPDSSPRPAAPLPPGTIIRAAEPRDIDAIVGLITALAEYESLTHLLELTPAKLAPHLFGDRPAAECLVAELPAPGAAGDAPAESQLTDRLVAGFALHFPTYSTFLARPGIHLEDLFVLPAYRGLGLGRALLARLAEIAVERGCGRLEWCVLDWNQPAIDFYQGLGAQMLPDWRLCRVTGTALDGFGR
jgi:GNAT superfamily N-acetyltransferase